MTIERLLANSPALLKTLNNDEPTIFRFWFYVHEAFEKADKSLTLLKSIGPKDCTEEDALALKNIESICEISDNLSLFNIVLVMLLKTLNNLALKAQKLIPKNSEVAEGNENEFHLPLRQIGYALGFINGEIEYHNELDNSDALFKLLREKEIFTFDYLEAFQEAWDALILDRKPSLLSRSFSILLQKSPDWEQSDLVENKDGEKEKAKTIDPDEQKFKTTTLEIVDRFFAKINLIPIEKSIFTANFAHPSTTQNVSLTHLLSGISFSSSHKAKPVSTTSNAASRNSPPVINKTINKIMELKSRIQKHGLYRANKRELDTLIQQIESNQAPVNFNDLVRKNYPAKGLFEEPLYLLLIKLDAVYKLYYATANNNITPKNYTRDELLHAVGLYDKSVFNSTSWYSFLTGGKSGTSSLFKQAAKEFAPLPKGKIPTYQI